MRAQLVIVVTEDLPGQDPTQAELLAQLQVSSTGDLFADVDTPTPLDQPVDPSTGDIYFEAAQTVTVSVVGGGVVVTKNFAAPSGSSPSPRIIDVSPDQLTLSGSAGGGLASGSGTSLQIVACTPLDFDTVDVESGVPIYTPTIGDFLIDAWGLVEIAFNGTAMKSDIALAVGFLGGGGWFGSAGPSPLLLDTADGTTGSGMGGSFDGMLTASTSQGSVAANQTYNDSGAWKPPRFATADPVMGLVSDTGQPGGDPPDGTTGRVVWFLLIGTPV